MSKWLGSRFRVAGRTNFSTGHYTEPLSEIRKREEKELRAMASVNLVILVGNLGAAPDLKYTQSGKPFCRFSLATTHKWTDSAGSSQEKTEWHRIIVWGPHAVNCQKYLSKGSQAYLEGKLETSSWEDNEGKKHSMTEINADTVKFLSPPKSQPQLPPHMNHDNSEPSFRNRNA